MARSSTLSQPSNWPVVWNERFARELIVADVLGLDSLLAAKAAVSHTHNGQDITGGMVAAARLGSGTPDATVFLRGDGTWAAPPGGASASGTVADLDGTGSAGVAGTYSRGDHKHADANRPADGEKAALVGTSGTPGAGNKYVTNGDTRLSDARTPTSHATSHKSGGGDAIKLDELAAPTDVTTLNASASAHGLLPKLSGTSTTYLDGTGAFSTPTATLPDLCVSLRVQGQNQTIAANYGVTVPADYEIGSGFVLELAADACLEVS